MSRRPFRAARVQRRRAGHDIAGDGRARRKGMRSRWHGHLGLSYHPDKAIDYDAVNWGLACATTPGPTMAWWEPTTASSSKATRFERQQGLVVPLSAGAENFQIARQGWFFMVGA